MSARRSEDLLTAENGRLREGKYLIWSNEHNAWWRANSQGYARDIRHAGIYSRGEAVEIARGSRNGWSFERAPYEIAVSLADIPDHIRAALSGETVTPCPLRDGNGLERGHGYYKADFS